MIGDRVRLTKWRRHFRMACGCRRRRWTCWRYSRSTWTYLRLQKKPFSLHLIRHSQRKIIYFCLSQIVCYLLNFAYSDWIRWNGGRVSMVLHWDSLESSRPVLMSNKPNCFDRFPSQMLNCNIVQPNLWTEKFNLNSGMCVWPNHSMWATKSELAQVWANLLASPNDYNSVTFEILKKNQLIRPMDHRYTFLICVFSYFERYENFSAFLYLFFIQFQWDISINRQKIHCRKIWNQFIVSSFDWKMICDQRRTHRSARLTTNSNCQWKTIARH